ncbi:MAG: glycosyltransferase family 4 protein [Patescibacteria group bacterium]|nr:glycosyltransferase family 4 protein [Patescibacteria group bacterium]
MKIAFFHELTPLSGARKVIEEYGKNLKVKHEIDLFYVDDVEDRKIKRIFNKVYFFEFKNKKWRGGDWKGKIYSDFLELIKLYFLHKKIAGIINKGDYDFVFVNPSKFTQAPFLLRMVSKTIYFCQEPLRMVYDPLFKLPENLIFFKKLYEKINRFNRRLIDKKNINKAKIVLANSLFSKDNIKKAYGLNAQLCYLGVDTDKFKPLKFKKTADLLFIGAEEFIEGFDLLSDTLSLYKNAPLLKFVARDINGIGISEENLITEINKSKIVLALSMSEPFGLIPIESMACEVPVIAVNEGGFKESVVNGKTGFLIERKPEQLEDRIDLLLSEDRLRIEMGKSGRKLVLGKFTWEKSANNFLNIAKTII